MAHSDNGTVPKFVFYHYDPSMAGAVIFIILFVITTFFHCYQLLRTRTWYFIPLVIGGFFEWIGYIGRALSSNQSPNWTLGPYILQTLLLLLAPALFAASIYMELGRIILLVDGEDRSIIKKKWLTKVFVAGDVVVVGLFIQIAFFSFFVVVALSFNRSINKAPTTRSKDPAIPWRKHIHTLYFTSILILIRSIFRCIEYIQGNDGYLLHHEIFIYIFDACLMLAVMVAFNVIYPSEVNALLKDLSIIQT
ncbi:RTA1 like protein-domain-containing protein [Xylogone sp. PMI_703]|nr:RTA1 like protein-domain-containing protein [Xylogone sp. PMI_703]